MTTEKENAESVSLKEIGMCAMKRRSYSRMPVVALLGAVLMTWPRIAPAQAECIDAVSGAGWVVAMPSGRTGRFEVSGGVGTLNFWGYLNYTDAAAALRVLSTAVTDYDVDPDNPRCRYIEYDVMINGKNWEIKVDEAGNVISKKIDNEEDEKNEKKGK